MPTVVHPCTGISSPLRFAQNDIIAWACELLARLIGIGSCRRLERSVWRGILLDQRVPNMRTEKQRPVETSEHKTHDSFTPVINLSRAS
jgi:hypothetical protein